jgi:glutamate synthase (NADPH/NADH) large chain
MTEKRTPAGLYDPGIPRGNCGVGFVACLDAISRHSVVEDGVKVLVNLEHRGAVGGDLATGDGAGLLLQIPDRFFRQEGAGLDFDLPPAGDYAVGSIYLPMNEANAGRCRRALIKAAEAEGTEVLGWRDVPVNPGTLGELSLVTRPKIVQLFLSRAGIDACDFERKLYVIRRLAEKEIAAWGEEYTRYFYVCSLSGRTILYKGMLTGTQLITFFPDLAQQDFMSNFALAHQRYSTNTLPTWPLAQPFRFMAHNGEINTLRGNINRMRGREAFLQSALFEEDIEKLKPVLIEGGSDSAIFDNMLELLVMGGRTIPHAVMMMIPEAWGTKFHMSADKRAFYEYHASIMEPWDGPAAITFTDGRFIGGTLDRNGLRPCRYTMTKDGLVVLSSETGVLELPPERIARHGRLQPGKMLLVDLRQNRVVPDNEIKAKIARSRPYRHWLQENRIELRGLFSPSVVPKEEPKLLRRKQHAFGYSEEELKMVISPMASRGQEPIGSMGNDQALAVLSTRPQLLFSYFKQLFAQVTNPPIDPLREELVMSLRTLLGRSRNLLDETPEHCRCLTLPHPILTPRDLAMIRRAGHPDLVVKEIDILFPAGGDGKALKKGLDKVFEKAVKAVNGGATVIILTDRNMDRKRAAIPALLASAGLHHHLIRAGLRTRTGIIIDTGEAREVNHFALLVGYGATAISPYVAFSTVREMAEGGLLEKDLTPEAASDNYTTAVKKGLLKTLSRMGISTARSYFGAQIFEALGLKKEVVDTYFTHTVSRIEGIGLNEIAVEAIARHRRGFPAEGEPTNLLDVGGVFHVRLGGEKHLWSPETIAGIQEATRSDSYEKFKEYSERVNDSNEEQCTLRGLFRFKKGTPVPLEEVEPVEKIFPRFVTAAMSVGSISRETHETVAIAMNRLGGRSNSGEGGEDPERFKPLPNGDSKCSKIKQVASGRFGVTTEYLVNSEELQIKIAQGAKPGEGGQLPGHKVSDYIAKIRHTTPGVTLISPPPHHDIYSIEDIAQLIYDLKLSNPSGKVSVKLVSEAGVGTVAAGVAKAKSDMVLISGYDGGTGASPLTAIKHAGLPWELGLAETQQALIANHLREYIRVQTDGGLRTGRDVIIGALLGAEEYGFGTAVLITLGCVMMRKCHLNTCPVGIATQDPELRAKFKGKPEHVINYLFMVAEEAREIMASLGFRTFREMVGRVDMLDTADAIVHWKAQGIDLKPILTPAKKKNAVTEVYCTKPQDHGLDKALDNRLIELAQPAITEGKQVRGELKIKNTNRTVGTMLSHQIAKAWGEELLPDETVRFKFEGSAGQSFGAWLAKGVTLELEGDANDYVGKGLSGGKIIVYPSHKATFVPAENVIIGNVVLYGAVEGKAFFRGRAAERFCVRNSGAWAVIEGVGDHACEYMTGGRAVILGDTGRNFGAGMSGGVAYVLDANDDFASKCNQEMVDLERLQHQEEITVLKGLIEEHREYTGSAVADRLLQDWDNAVQTFVKVMPTDYRRVLRETGDLSLGVPGPDAAQALGLPAAE